MGALVQTNWSGFRSARIIKARSARLRPKPVDDALAREPRAFPEARLGRELPLMIRDEMLELYAFIFCQGGFRQLGMTFEQFLLVAAAIKPHDLIDSCGDEDRL
jgi:hypothetical protein